MYSCTTTRENSGTRENISHITKDTQMIFTRDAAESSKTEEQRKLEVVSVENQLLSIFYIMKLYHDLKFNHTYIFSHFLIRDGN